MRFLKKSSKIIETCFGYKKKIYTFELVKRNVKIQSVPHRCEGRMSYNEIVKLASENYPPVNDRPVKYGTAGFRTKAAEMDFIMFRMGLLAVLRSKMKKAAIGVMITASHNPVEDNGVKLVDPLGEMLTPEWEDLATQLTNATAEGIIDLLKRIIEKYSIDENEKALVFVGRDTRPSSPRLLDAVISGVKIMGGEVKDFGIVSTPIVHFVVTCHNDGGKYGTPSEEGYFSKISSAFVSLRSETTSRGNYKPEILFDGANGVGAYKMIELLDYLKGTLQMEIFNKGEGELNYKCGADFVKTYQSWPNGVPKASNTRCASVDGDADRVIYSYIDGNEGYHLLDGDKIASLVAGHIKKLVTKAGLDLQIGLVQTAYANGASTEYITSVLGIPVTCTETGVKFLHHAALNFDIGVYFEANGHGTVLFSAKAKKAIETILEGSDFNAEAVELSRVMSIINETVGDAISDMLLVETVLLANGWSCEDWNKAYTDLPNRLMKVTVADRSVVTTTDAERVCVKPKGLQETINGIVAKYSKGRAFVRASGTEDIIRIYAESSTKANADKLAYEVACSVYEQAGGVGEAPKVPS